jgi:hypothetical protein
VLAEIAARHSTTPHEVALAWLLDVSSHVVPISGATREVTARSIGRASALALSDRDRAQLDERFPSGRSLRQPRIQSAAAAVRACFERTDWSTVRTGQARPSAGVASRCQGSCCSLRFVIGWL